MTQPIAYVRLFADEHGKSRMERNLEVELKTTDFVPPAPAIGVSTPQPASACAFLSVPAGYFGDWHASPKRQWLVFISGQMEFETEDGERFLGRPGAVVLLEDTLGRGHRSTVPTDAPAVMLAVQL
jgi:quercetin dioxygenase-like cupin family protein